jgi:hypothetical protein
MGVRKPYSLSLLTNPVGERQGAQLRFCFNFALLTRFRETLIKPSLLGDICHVLANETTMCRF